MNLPKSDSKSYRMNSDAQKRDLSDNLASELCILGLHVQCCLRMKSVPTGVLGYFIDFQTGVFKYSESAIFFA
jgi:hypothetical protein